MRVRVTVIVEAFGQKGSCFDADVDAAVITRVSRDLAINAMSDLIAKCEDLYEGRFEDMNKPIGRRGLFVRNDSPESLEFDRQAREHKP